MKGERQQDQIQEEEDRPFGFGAEERALGAELCRAASVASAAAEFIAADELENDKELYQGDYLKRGREYSTFLVLHEGLGERLFREDTGTMPGGPCLIRSEEWLHAPELAELYNRWLSETDEAVSERMLQRIYYRLRASASALLESAEGMWSAVTLLQPPELAASPYRMAVLQDVQLEALFAAVAERHRHGRDGRLDLLAPYPASASEFARLREFIEDVAEQTLGHADAAACRIGALLAPATRQAAAAEIGRIADFVVIDGAAGEAAPEDAAGFARAAGDVLAAVRRVKPAAVVLAAGAPAAAALADLYRIGMSGIFCSAAQRTEALLRAACLTWIARQDHVDTAAGGWL